jgi:Rrf2 family protein
VKVSKKTEYGLRAMVAIAKMAGQDKPVPLSTIAESEGIPEQFLDQIVAKLRKAGFVKSIRGVNGGYMLSRPASEISIGSLVRLLEGSLAPIACISEEVSDANASCGRISVCHTRNIWLRVMDALTNALDSITLADVMRDEVPLQQITGV